MRLFRDIGRFFDFRRASRRRAKAQKKAGIPFRSFSFFAAKPRRTTARRIAKASSYAGRLSVPRLASPKVHLTPVFRRRVTNEVPPAGKVRIKKSIFLHPRPDGVPDILDAIQELGGIAAPSQSRFADKGDYDGYRESFQGAARLLTRRTGGMRPDELTEALSNPESGIGQTWRLESTSDLYDAVQSAVQSREKAKRQFRQELEDENFRESALTPKKRQLACRRPLRTDQLSVGDTFRIRREPCKVTDLDPDTEELAVKCGDRYRYQRLPPATEFYPDKCKVEKSAKPNPAGDLFAEPESVIQQRLRLDREAVAREKAGQRSEMLERAGRRLVGRSVDTTGDLFHPTAGSAPLFALKRKNPVRLCRKCKTVRLFAQRTGRHWTIRTAAKGGLVIARRLTETQVRNWGRSHGYKSINHQPSTINRS